jgi:hypothetical protein
MPPAPPQRRENDGGEHNETRDLTVISQQQCSIPHARTTTAA